MALLLSFAEIQKGFRAVPLPNDATEELKKLKKRQTEEKLLMGGAHQDQGFIFTWEDGRMVDPLLLVQAFLEINPPEWSIS